MDYINYVVAILRKAKEHGFRCFIDPHQDGVFLLLFFELRVVG